jgi:AcrR family transcriptional regulator
MARPHNPKIRARLRNQAIDYVISHGLGDLTLRPLAKALKTNARMLVYHFRSREGLMREVLKGLREREDARIRSWFRTGKMPRTIPQFLRWYWKRISARQAKPALRLVFELYASALRDPQKYPRVLEDPLAYWLSLTEKAGISSKSKVDRAEATLLLAATRGLSLDLCATGNRHRVAGAMELLAQFVEWRATSTKRIS